MRTRKVYFLLNYMEHATLIVPSFKHVLNLPRARSAPSLFQRITMRLEMRVLFYEGHVVVLKMDTSSALPLLSSLNRVVFDALHPNTRRLHP